MSRFLILIPAEGATKQARQIFESGLTVSQLLFDLPPSKIFDSNWALAASFTRVNGTGTPLVIDPETGSWLVACGTWFHRDEYGAGEEKRLLQRYLKIGSKCLALELEGFFVIAVGDGRTKNVEVITDIVGSCHAFYRTYSGGVAVSTSSFILAGLGQIHLDPIACQEFLGTGVIYENRTVYSEVKKLGPSRVYEYGRGGKYAEEQYWQVSDLSYKSLSDDSAIELLVSNLTNAVKKISQVFKHQVCDLTGGYDSRAVVAAFLASGIRFSATVSGPPNSQDVLVSKRIAKTFNFPHLHIPDQTSLVFDDVKKMLPVTDGEYDMVEYANVFRVHHQLSKSFDVSINGSFGELARGYWWELLFPHAGDCKRLDAQHLSKKRYATQKFDASIFLKELRVNLTSHLAGVIERTNKNFVHFPNTVQMDHAYLMMRMQRWQGRIASSTNQLWPCLSVFVFRSVLEVILQANVTLRRRNLLVCRMLVAMERRLAEIPLEHGWPALPVKLDNFYRFWPAPIFYGQKIVSRVMKNARNYLGQGESPVKRVCPRLHLWREEEVQSLLRSSTMEIRQFCDSSSLARFLDHSKQADFTFDDEWSRLLTLEYAQAILKQIGSSKEI